MRAIILVLALAGCSGTAFVFDVESDSLRAEEPRDPFGTNDIRLEVN